MRAQFVVAMWLIMFASVAMAQNPRETKWHCEKPASQQKLDVGDEPGHSYVIAQGSCTATSSANGEKTGVYTEFQELQGSTFTNRGRLIATLSDGDKAYYNYEGRGDMETKSASNRWKIIGGTGKHKSARATGSCSGIFSGDGDSNWVCRASSTAN